MQMPEILDNVNRTVRDDLATTIAKGDKLSIAAACFSIYAYQALKKQLDGVSELRFIFTSPAFLSVWSFRITLDRIKLLINGMIADIDAFMRGEMQTVSASDGVG